MIDAHLYDQIKWPCDLSKIVIEKLKQIAVLKQGIDALEITKRYQNVPGVYYILSGSAGLCFSTQNMHHMSGGVIGRGDWIGALAVYKEYQLFAVAEEVNPLSMVFFPRKKFVIWRKKCLKSTSGYYIVRRKATRCGCKRT